jgi:hypothetical protein
VIGKSDFSWTGLVLFYFAKFSALGASWLMPAQKLSATNLNALYPEPLPAIARKDAVKKFMEGKDAYKVVHKSDADSGLAISISGCNLFPPISPSPSKSSFNAMPAEYTVQMLHGMPSPCKIRGSPGLLQPPSVSKHQRLARIEMKIDGLLSGQSLESPPTVSKNQRLARVEQTIDGSFSSSSSPSASDALSPDLRRLHGALLNSRSPQLQLSKIKLRRKTAHEALVDSVSEGPCSLSSRLGQLESTVDECFARLSVSHDGAAAGWLWLRQHRLQKIEDRLDQILSTALDGSAGVLHSAQLNPIFKRNQLLPHVIIAAAAQERRMHAENLMKLQGKSARELQAALAFNIGDKSFERIPPRRFVPARCM